MTTPGKYYLSIFVGTSGSTTRTTYTITGTAIFNNLNDSPPPTPSKISLD
jgi:hypothetical protein